FDGVLLVLPPGEGPELTRELIYTGITRARTRVEVRCSETGFREAVLRRVGRHSGLAAALAAPASPKAAGNEKR
ncbi:MAG TPA: hypothetical protein PK636_08775, partial [bacterium]|nr:hypothetical protein [bacterium]